MNNYRQRHVPPPAVIPTRRRRRSTSEIGCCLKYSMFGFNVIFWILGGIVMFVGTFAFVEKEGTFQDIGKASNVPIDPALTLFSVGALTFVVAFAGCIGALRENICFLNFFAFVLGLLFFGETVLGVAGYFRKDWVRHQVERFMLKNIETYRSDVDMQDIVDALQIELECCGASQPDDWNLNRYFNCTQSWRQRFMPESCGVPFSCCQKHVRMIDGIINTQCGYQVRRSDPDNPINLRNDKIYSIGCVAKIKTWFNDNVWVLCFCAISVIILEVIAISFALNLTSAIKRQQNRWQPRR